MSSPKFSPTTRGVPIRIDEGLTVGGRPAPQPAPTPGAGVSVGGRPLPQPTPAPLPAPTPAPVPPNTLPGGGR